MSAYKDTKCVLQSQSTLTACQIFNAGAIRHVATRHKRIKKCEGINQAINITFARISPRGPRFIKTHLLRDDKINREKSSALLISERFPFTVPVSRLGAAEADEIYRPKRPRVPN